MSILVSFENYIAWMTNYIIILFQSKSLSNDHHLVSIVHHIFMIICLMTAILFPVTTTTILFLLTTTAILFPATTTAILFPATRMTSGRRNARRSSSSATRRSGHSSRRRWPNYHSDSSCRGRWRLARSASRITRPLPTSSCRRLVTICLKFHRLWIRDAEHIGQLLIKDKLTPETNSLESQWYLHKFKKVTWWYSVRVFVTCPDPRFIQFALASCFAVHINALSISWKCTSKGRKCKFN